MCLGSTGSFLLWAYHLRSLREYPAAVWFCGATFIHVVNSSVFFIVGQPAKELGLCVLSWRSWIVHAIRDLKYPKSSIPNVPQGKRRKKSWRRRAAALPSQMFQTMIMRRSWYRRRNVLWPTNVPVCPVRRGVARGRWFVLQSGLAQGMAD